MKKVAKKKADGRSNKKMYNDEKLLAFARIYAVHFDGVKAVKEINPKLDTSSAGTLASRWLREPIVKNEIIRIIEKGTMEAEISVARTMRELFRIGFADVRKLFDPKTGKLKPPGDWDDDTAAAIAGLETLDYFEGQGEERELAGVTNKIKLNNKNQALELIGKRYKMWIDVVENRNTDLADKMAKAEERLKALEKDKKK